MSFSALLETVSQRFGLKPRDSWRADLERAASGLARDLAIPVPSLLQRAEREPGVLRDLAGQLTVDESYFLRDPGHFDRALRAIEERVAAGRPFAAWSAGCSRGEEPHSLALLVAERLPWARPALRIVASDLSREALRQAREGLYADWSLRGVPERLRAAYFQREASKWRLAQAVRAAVSFQHLSLGEHLAQLPDGTLDLVFFRNVGIYLTPRALEEAFRGFWRVLAPGGLLVLGPSDPVPPRERFALDSEPSSSVYRRRGDESAARPASRPSSPSSPPSAEWPADASRLYARASQLGDAGRLDEALELAGRVVALTPEWAAGWQLRGTLRLASARPAEAVADLRRAVFLAPDDPLPRFFYATALREAGVVLQARAEARALAERLRALPPEAVLGDGHSSAASLLKGTTELLEGPED